jgi:hypothetical protein
MINRMRHVSIVVGFVASSFTLSHSLLAQTPEALQQEPIFQITYPLEFRGRVVSGRLGKSDIPRLLDLPVRNGDSDLKEGYGVEMTRPNGERFRASTCHEWENAQREQAYAATTYDMSMESPLIHTCGLLFRLQTAKIPAKSFVANPKVTLADVRLLPAEMLNAVDEDQKRDQQSLRGLAVAQVVPAKDITEVNEKALSLSYGGLRQIFWEAARADFDGKGLEEIFVFAGGRAEGGTMGYAENLILTRTVQSGPLSLVTAKSASGKQ